MPGVGFGGDPGTTHLACATYDGRVLHQYLFDLHLQPCEGGHIRVALQDEHIVRHLEPVVDAMHAELQRVTNALVEKQIPAGKRGANASRTTMLQVSQGLVGLLRGRYRAMPVGFIAPTQVRSLYNTSVALKDTGLSDEQAYRARKALGVLAMSRALTEDQARAMVDEFVKLDDVSDASLLAILAYFSSPMAPRTIGHIVFGLQHARSLQLLIDLDSPRDLAIADAARERVFARLRAEPKRKRKAPAAAAGPRKKKKKS